MKKLINPLRGLLLVFLLANCGGKIANEKVAYSGKTAMRVTYWVKSYPEWLKVYKEVSDSNSWIGLYVSPDDPNLVTVYELTQSHEQAKKEFSSEEARRNMKRAGVTSEPMISYFDIKYRNLPKSPRMYRVEITHDVADYDAWKKVFDAGEERRTAAGMELRGIFVDADNSTMVGVVVATDDLDQLKSMLASPQFEKLKKEATVASRETVIVLKMPPR